MLSDNTAIERLTFFNGQQLYASDLQGMEELNRRLRWLHNQSLHQPGIGNGYAVAGNKGDRQVNVQPGYALDALGREIVLLDTHSEQIPPVASEASGQSVFYDLTVAYPQDSDLEEVETREGVCLPAGTVRRREAPVFCWIRLRRDSRTQGNLRPVNPTLAQEIQQGLRIVLARAEVLNCQLYQNLSLAPRRNARPPRQPYVACGTQLADWAPWEIDTGQDENVQKTTIGLTAPITTADAAFQATPCYSARIDGTRPAVFAQGAVVLFDGPLYIQSTKPDSFTAFLIIFPSHFGSHADMEEVTKWARANWRVEWMGVEE